MFNFNCLVGTYWSSLRLSVYHEDVSETLGDFRYLGCIRI